MSENHLRTQNFKIDFLSSSLDKLIKINQQQNWISILDDSYPQQLKEIYLPPIILFYAGDINLLTKNAMLGVVGSRKCSKYAVSAMKKAITSKVTDYFVIVSGLAAGVDTLGHQITLANQGKTIAVLGTGLNRYYPYSNQRLQQQLMADQLVLSEYGLDDGPKKFHFVERNRIIAGLSQKLLVVEAREKSGSLITASLALRENREVLAIPGNIDSYFSTGANELIAAGGQPCLDERDLLGRVVI
ncbi:DNA protecting protein DprA [Fructilactobacillus lindneri DSM 20690 = JCM 11027]|uniref:DNA protecting protein DprA n=1 Tax=Fructilactobacillus lindneri DSM 20690 = JCM 11027 TaxID=1122148 RepID=A0A0R2JVD3_9LACO|nr:DNA protecting protein DprA [Fructilactobacillus lindneri DSM 20690 = JCM 11027]